MSDAPSERDNAAPEPVEPVEPPAPPAAEPAPEVDHGWAGPTVLPDLDTDGDGDAEPLGRDEAGIRDINETDIF